MAFDSQNRHCSSGYFTICYDRCKSFCYDDTGHLERSTYIYFRHQTSFDNFVFPPPVHSLVPGQVHLVIHHTIESTLVLTNLFFFFWIPHRLFCRSSCIPSSSQTSERSDPTSFALVCSAWHYVSTFCAENLSNTLVCDPPLPICDGFTQQEHQNEGQVLASL